MTSTNNVHKQFIGEISHLAALSGLRLTEDQVYPTFSAVDEQRGEASVCFRVTAESEEHVKACSAVLRGMRRIYTAQRAGRRVLVTCTLAGAQVDGRYVDWNSRPTDTLG